MTEEEIQNHLEAIEKMTQYDACYLWRNAPTGHPYFISDTILAVAFKKKFDELGGMTPSISKQIGWD